MSDCQKMRAILKNFDLHLSSFKDNIQRSAELERVIAQIMGFIFHLRYFNAITDDKNVVNKVIWLGEEGVNLKNAPPEGPDVIIYARHFDILVEVTEATGTKQWDREYSRSVKHLDNYISQHKKSRADVYLLLITKEICIDMYHSIKAKVDLGSNIVMFTFKDIERVLEVCNLTIGLRHIELKELFSSLARDSLDTPNLPSYNRKAMRTLNDWRKSLLRTNQLVYIGIKGYKLFERLESINTISASYLATKLLTQKEVKMYCRILGESINREHIRKSMLLLGFACEFGIKQIDPILTIVSKEEVNERINEILNNI